MDLESKEILIILDSLYILRDNQSSKLRIVNQKEHDSYLKDIKILINKLEKEYWDY